MIRASICTIGDEILIGQIVDTNSSSIAARLQEELGADIRRMTSVGDNAEDIKKVLSKELEDNDIVIVTGGLGPTEDDITSRTLGELFGCTDTRIDDEQMRINREILASRGLETLSANVAQAMVPSCCEVINNRLGTAPIMVFTHGTGSRLYSMPGVPHETLAALGDVISDIREHFSPGFVYHRCAMVYGLAESALAEKISVWRSGLPDYMHLAFLPSTLTGVRLRLSACSADTMQSSGQPPLCGVNSVSGTIAANAGNKDTAGADGRKEAVIAAIDGKIEALREVLGEDMYSDTDDSLQAVIGRVLRENGKTLSAAESCTGGEISHLLTLVPGSSSYYLGSVTSYAISVKEKILGVPHETIEENGVVSSEVAAAMARGVRNVTGSDYSVSTTGLAQGCDDRNPEGTVWVGVSGPHGTETRKFRYHNDRERNIERFAASALDFLRRYIVDDINS